MPLETKSGPIVVASEYNAAARERQRRHAHGTARPTVAAFIDVDLAVDAALAESAVNEIVANRMIKKQQMRVQPFHTVRVAVLNDTLEQAFRSWHAGFRPAEDRSAPRAA